MEIHGEISSFETSLGKSCENMKASAEAPVSSWADLGRSTLSYSSSSALRENNTSLSKLNAQAPVFVPGAYWSSQVNAESPVFVPRAEAAVDMGGLTSWSFTEHPLAEQFFEQKVLAYPTPFSKAALTEELREMVEFYFSDAILPTNKYLMKFVKKDPEGFVPITVVASLRRVKSLVSNHSLVAAALRTSSQLVVSEDGKRVRRLHPLAETGIAQVQSGTVVAENDNSIQNLEKLGNVKLVPVFQPQRYDSRQVLENDMFVRSKLPAVVEHGGNWRSGGQVQMGKHGHQTKGRQSNVHGEEENTNNRNDKQSKVTTQHSDRHDEFEGGRKGRGRGRGRGRGKARGRGRFHDNDNGRGNPVGTTLSSCEVVVKQPPGPRLPDGTRGFTMGRGRPLADSNV